MLVKAQQSTSGLAYEIMENKTLLCTGGAGFIGHHIIEGVLKNTEWNIVILDRLDISGNLERLRDIKIWEEKKHRVKFVWWDLKSEINDQLSKEIGKINYIWHLAAGSHVDRSIERPLDFAMDNTIGTVNLLNYARKNPVEKFVYFSTDEAFGPAPEGVDFKEGDRHNPGNPYAASKAAAEDFCVAFANTYKMPVMITNTMNVFGERQHPEKFIPIIIRKVLNAEKLTVHDGSRYWIHARNICGALIYLMENVDEFIDIHDETKGKFNLVGEREINNRDFALMIAEFLGKGLMYEVVDTRECRPGHDKRYSLDGEKLKKVGFEYPTKFEQSLKKTVQWYLKENNKRWL